MIWIPIEETAPPVGVFIHLTVDPREFQFANLQIIPKGDVREYCKKIGYTHWKYDGNKLRKISS